MPTSQDDAPQANGPMQNHSMQDTPSAPDTGAISEIVALEANQRADPFGWDDIAKTRSSFIPKDAAATKKGKSITGKVPIFLVLLVIVVFVGIWVRSEYVIIGAGLILGPILIFEGWLEFSLLQLIEGMPTSQLEAAAEGLNEIQATFLPENNATLMSPLAGQRCIFYQLDLQRLVHTKNGYYWQTIAHMSEGIPVLLTDGTGYLAIDLADADMDYAHIIGTRYHVVNNEDDTVTSRSKVGQGLLKYFESKPATFDLQQLGVTLSESYKQTFTVFGGTDLSILERAIPINTSVFAMGRVVGTAKSYQDKSLKLMVYDKNTKILSVRSVGKDSLEKTDRTFTYAGLIIGAIALLSSVALLIVTLK